MQLFAIEVREILIRRRGLWLILLSLLAYGLLLQNADGIWVDSYYNEWKDAELFRELEGPLTEGKETLIREKQAQYEEAAAGLAREREKYRTGQQSREEYEENAAEYIRVLGEYQLVRLASNQYDYVRKNPEGRYFINANGWNWFFGGHSFSIICVVVLLLLTIPVFMTETESGTHELMRSCSRGCGSLYLLRFGAGILLAVLYTAAVLLLELGTAQALYGLGPADFPLASLSLYQHYQGEMKIGEMLARAVLCRLLGASCFAALCMTLSIFLKNSLGSFVAGLLIYFAPYFLLTEERMYQLPLPLPLFEADAYICGYQQAETGTRIFYSNGEVAGIYAIAVACSALLIFLGFCLYHEKIRLPRNIGRKAGIMGGAAICLLCLEGCAEVSYPENYTVNPAVYSYLIDGEQYAVIATESPFLLYDKQTGKTEELFADPLFSAEDYEEIFPMFLAEDQLYYLRRSEGYESIWQMDCRTHGTEKICDLRQSEPEGISFWGIGGEATGRSYDQYLTYLEQCQAFYLWEDQIFVLTGEGIQRFDKTGKPGEMVITDLTDQPAYRDGNFYYRDSYGFLVQYDAVSGERTVLSDTLAEEFRLGGDRLYFTDAVGNLYAVSLRDGTQLCLRGGVGQLLHGTEKRIYYRKEGGSEIYVFSDGMEASVVQEGEVLQLAEADGKYLYIVIDETGNIQWESGSRRES